MTDNYFFFKTLQCCYSVPWEGCVGEGEIERLRAQRVKHCRTLTNILSVYLSISPNSYSATGLVSKRNILLQRAMNYLQWIHVYTIYWSDHFIKSLGLHSNPPDKLWKEFRWSFCTTRLPVLTQVESAGLCRCYTIPDLPRRKANKSPLHFENFQIFFHRNTMMDIWFAIFKSINRLLCNRALEDQKNTQCSSNLI